MALVRLVDLLSADGVWDSVCTSGEDDECSCNACRTGACQLAVGHGAALDVFAACGCPVCGEAHALLGRMGTTVDAFAARAAAVHADDGRAQPRPIPPL